jgi:hypothetical protein
MIGKDKNNGKIPVKSLFKQLTKHHLSENWLKLVKLAKTS